MGLSTAYYLVKKGKRVLLLEKNELGSGASGACDEMILLQSKKPGNLLTMAIESLEMYRGLSEELKMEINFEVRGGMVFIENYEQLRVMEEFVERQRSFGLNVEIIDRGKVYEKQPYARDGILASTYSPSDAQVYPFKVMRGYLARGIEQGLEIRKKVEISHIIQKNGYWKIELEDQAPVEAEYIVNAAGAWAGEIGKMIDIEIPVRPIRGQVAVTEPIAGIGETNVWSAEYIVRKIKPELSLRRDQRCEELGIGFALSQAATGNFLLGSSREEAGFSKSTTFEVVEKIGQQVVEFFPIFKKVNIIRTFAGLRPATPDGKPILGEVAGREGFFIAAGHEGDGVALAPLTGKMTADLICGQRLSKEFQALKLDRFL
ncbi:hypothetical protein Gferi_20270 [Geosporobacter ferrireducens]|uniref:FAD dependent oxidoreductase domain-containing protein n=2 Tax=Geosporobacter ferrireducens TaxID=1424294 RepID=A0A1D8GQT3_9FIRM|nr:hypothetical protein Gferi_20270 [Geosporobacter ferrireducens]